MVVRESRGRVSPTVNARLRHSRVMDTPTLREELLRLYERVVAAAKLPQAGLPPEEEVSLSNLYAYRELRRHDIAALQMALADAGLSSLGRLEGQVLDSLVRVLRWLGAGDLEPLGPTRAEAAELLEQRSRRLLGRPRAGRTSRIMVTLDHLQPDLPEYTRRLLLAGMDIARINGAHGTAADWTLLADAIRTAEKTLAAEGRPPGRRCRIAVDLSGPRIRIGAVPGTVRLGAGDRFRLARLPGATALAAKGDEPVLMTCTLPGALANARVGESVFIDDGKFAAKVECETPGWVEARMIWPARKRKVKPGKGLNFPETAIDLPAR